MGVIEIPANSSGYDEVINDLNKHAGIISGDGVANWTLEYIYNKMSLVNQARLFFIC